MRIADEVAGALAAGRPVLACESTIVTHGLPRPRNLQVALDAEALVRDRGAVPATIGVLDGEVVVGLSGALAARRPPADQGRDADPARDRIEQAVRNGS